MSSTSTNHPQIGGAIVGVLGTMAVERQRRQHEDSTRWHRDRLAAYGRVLREAREFRRGMQDWHNVWTVRHENRDAPTLDELRGAMDEGQLMAASKSLAAAILGLSTRATLLRSHSVLTDRLTEEEWEESQDDFDEAVSAFEDAARSELGISEPS